MSHPDATVLDREIEQAIRQAMVYDKRLAAQPIDVSVHQGTVLLKGVVQSYRRAAAAHEVAASLAGVREVVNELVVEPPNGIEDSDVADHVRAALAAHADVVKEAIIVAASGGVVTLQGSVRDTWQSAIAEDVARSACGVRKVCNLLVANLMDQVDDAEASLDVQAAIRRACGLLKADIKVAVGGQTAVLSGTVATFRRKEVAEQIARRFGLLHVRNEIRVVPQ